GTRDRVALFSHDLDAVEDDRARTRRHHAHQALECRALAGAVAAKQRHDLVALDAQRDVEQDVRIAVVAVQPLDLQQAHCAAPPFSPPRYASCTFALPLISPGVPSTSTRPSWSTVTRPASSNSASMS